MSQEEPSDRKPDPFDELFLVDDKYAQGMTKCMHRTAPYRTR